MKLLALFIFLALLLLALSIVLKKRGLLAAKETPWPFHAKKPLTQPEQVLYFRLQQALPECIVLAQVSLSSVLGVNKGVNFAQWHNRINRMSLDFVVCLKDATIVAVIELDDKTHERKDRIAADQKKDKALAAAGIAVLRWKVNAIPDCKEIRDAFTR